MMPLLGDRLLARGGLVRRRFERDRKLLRFALLELDVLVESQKAVRLGVDAMRSRIQWNRRFL
jgi:hypothetical protein